ncbi:hypothetical protein, conserved [Eimeria praecox]|uniref:Uncharacterized protein n=1 Tax=Eimeria praecox TaxID=51316 RepID=U6GJP9_9EIME|nr:hypothetical protein, conserved [Eimeria praecox]
MFKRLMNEELEGAPIFLLDLEGSRVAPVPALYVGEKSKSEEDAEGLYSRLYQILDELQNSTDDEDEAKISFSELPEYCAGQEFAKRCLASEQRPWWAYFQAGGLWLQILDELQNSTDDEDEAKVSFSELPEYCAGQEFAKRCLASEQRPWWAYFQAGGLWLQLGLLVAVGGSMFFAWNKISAEKFVCGISEEGGLVVLYMKKFVCGILLFSLAVGAWSSLQPILSSLFGGK